MKQKQDIKNIELSFVCPQNWDNMTICGNGRFCSVCQKTVYDFTDKSQKEYIKRGINIFNEEALRVVKLMSVGMWKGGKQNGQPAKVAYTIPIKFILE